MDVQLNQDISIIHQTAQGFDIRTLVERINRVCYFKVFHFIFNNPIDAIQDKILEEDV